MRSIASIKPYESNPRENDSAVNAVAGSIQTFGFRQPIVVDKDGIIVVGHTRYKAALKLGLTEVPVHVAHDLTPAQARAYRIADNQIATLSTWDQDLLTQEIIQLQEWNVDLDVLGFSAEDLLRYCDPPNAQGATDPDDIPDPPERPETRPGDLILLGKHRLLCGD